MERSRFVTVALLVFSSLTVVNARHLIEFTLLHLCIITSVAISVHIIALACSTRRRLQPISPLISFIALVQVLLIANAQGSFGKMFPTPGTVIDLIHDTRLGIIALRSGEIPLGFSVPVFLVAIIVAWIVAEIGETLAQRLHSSAPTLIWYIIISASVTAQKGTTNLTLVILSTCAACWFFLYAFDKGHERNRSHLISIPRSSQVTNITTYIIAFIILGIISTLLVVPLKSIPSLAPKNVFNFLSNSSEQNELSPLVGMKEQLTQRETETLFTATSSEAQYWRTNVLPDFDGDTWTSTSKTEQSPERIPGAVQARSINARVQLTTLVSKFLPTYYSTQSISSRDVELLKDGVIYSKKAALTSYELTAQVPTTELTQEQIAMSSGNYPSSIETYTLLPITFDKKHPIVLQAQEIASNRGSIYEQVIAMRDFFQDGSFTYDLNVDYSSSTSAMEQFLKDRRGFCEQFATTYAVFARSVGIPARVIVGFTPGEPDANGIFTITNRQAHSWVEVYLSNFGWLTVDPTPAGPLPGQAPNNIGAAVTTTSTTTTTSVTVPPVSESVATIPVTTLARTQEQPVAQKSRSNLLLFLLVGLGFAGGFISFIVIRRKRGYTSKNDRIYVVETFNTIGKRVLNVPPEPNLTIAELVERVPENNEIIREFLALLTLASYAPDSDISWHELRSAAGKARAERIAK